MEKLNHKICAMRYAKSATHHITALRTIYRYRARSEDIMICNIPRSHARSGYLKNLSSDQNLFAMRYCSTRSRLGATNTLYHKGHILREPRRNRHHPGSGRSKRAPASPTAPPATESDGCSDGEAAVTVRGMG